MARSVLTTEEFISKAIELHGDKYDYSKVEYVKTILKVSIICKIHGEFLQIPNSHLSGHNCPKCNANGNRTLTTEDFILKATKIHGVKYDYSEVVYTGSMNKVIIICKTHGEFLQKANYHLMGGNCSKCSSIARKGGRRGIGGKPLTTEEFISNAIKVHGTRYDYSKVEYINAQMKVVIGCPIHGDFEQRPKVHVNLEANCQHCARMWRSTDYELAKEM